MYSTFAFTPAGVSRFHAFLSNNLKSFDLDFERSKRGYELEALDVFDSRKPDETLSYELRQNSTVSGTPVCYYPLEDDLVKTISATETALRSIITFPADWEVGQPGVAYGAVEYNGKRFNIQYSRPRHPSNIGQVLESGVDVYTDEGHDPNSDFEQALGDEVDWTAVVSLIVFASQAEAAIDASENA